MKRPFVLTREAKNDTAERVRSEFYDGLRLLGQSPGIGHYHEELLSRRYRFWNFYSYVVAYVWEAKPIQVVSVVHGGRDLAVFFTLRLSPRDEPKL